MLGIPYWGESTFDDIRNLDEFPVYNVTSEKIKECNNLKRFTGLFEDFYTVFKRILEDNLVVVIRNNGIWFSWARDIRFNYRDREVFLPYYTYELFEYKYRQKPRNTFLLDFNEDRCSVIIRHSFTMGKYIIEDLQKDERVSELELFDPETKERFIINIDNIPHLKEKTFSLKEMHKRYASSAYVENSLDDDIMWKRYIRIGNRYGRNREYRLRSRLGLPHYKGKFKQIDHTDQRVYDLDKYLELGVVEDIRPYWLRVFEFEAYIYCVFAQGVLPEEQEYVEPFKELGISRRYLTYKDQGLSLILKHYYKGQTSLRRKSYERYRW